jgi:hypothetical protein
MTNLFAFFLMIFWLGSALAQPAKYPNELRGFNLINHPKLKGYAVGTTRQEDVEATFGKDCESQFCYLDEDWSVKFYFFSKGQREMPRDPKFPRSVPIIRYDGRLRAIVLKSVVRFSLKPDKFGKQFSRVVSTLFERGAIYSKSKLWNYQDRYGLRYRTLGHLSPLGNEHDLLEIEYGIPPIDEAKAFEEW